ncbi:MAG: ArsA family ATPase [Deltaproteobacteria bacterium]|nr:ArsA family ATPase [Deltaproteobacteria bacterium]
MSKKKKKNLMSAGMLPDVRVILFTGKGGVGKTSVAAATSVLSSQLGHGTLIMSTDAAHSLSDAFDMNIGPEPTVINKKLWGVEIDINEQVGRHWGAIHDFLTQFLKHRGFDSIIADELAIMPGMEEIFSLLAVRHYAEDERFNTIIIDCAPTADTARLLAIPDIAQWYMEKVFHIERKIVKTIRPFAKRIIDTPLPTERVFDSVEILYQSILGVRDLLVDRTRTTIRMVVNPEKMVIKEAQRAYTFLSLFDFGIDAVVVNRLLPEKIKDPFYDKWKEIQAEHMAFIHESFMPLPILTVHFWDEEIIGYDLLSKMAKEIYNKKDPTKILHKEKPINIYPSDGHYVMEIPLPFARREDMETWINEDELVIKFKNFKRNIILPRSLAKRELYKAELKDRTLKLFFEGETNA